MLISYRFEAQMEPVIGQLRKRLGCNWLSGRQLQVLDPAMPLWLIQHP